MSTLKTIRDYSPAFEIAIAFVLSEEGGFVDDPADKGGATNYGISQRAYPDLDIKSLTVEQAKAIYYQDYWQPCCCEMLPAAVACVVFDTAVNMGQGAAIRFLQQSAGVKVDGIIGPVTITACYEPRATLVCDYLSHRAKRYHRIAKDETQTRFIRGWMKRTYELQQHIYKEGLLWL